MKKTILKTIQLSRTKGIFGHNYIAFCLVLEVNKSPVISDKVTNTNFFMRYSTKSVVSFNFFTLEHISLLYRLNIRLLFFFFLLESKVEFRVRNLISFHCRKETAIYLGLVSYWRDIKENPLSSPLYAPQMHWLTRLWQATASRSGKKFFLFLLL